MTPLRPLLALLLLACTAGAADLVIVVGAPGTEDFGKAFERAANAWEEAGKRGEARVTIIGRENTGPDVTALEETLTTLRDGPPTPLWLVLIGHGTFDGREARFNLRGKDFSATELAGWLEGGQRPVAIINTSASSAPFLKKLSDKSRVVVTATKSGYEESYARFGEFLAPAMDSPDADIDRDGATSLLEAFLAATKGVEEFYEKEGRIVTEQALIDDNGDGFGTPASWFRGVRAVKTAKNDAEPDGLRAHQLQLVPSEAERRLPPEIRKERDALEASLFALRARKAKMDEDAYYRELERIARQLAELYERAASEDDDS